MSLARLVKNERELKRLLEAQRVGTAEELYLALGYGKLQVEAVVNQLRGESSGGPESDNPRPELKTGAIERIVRKVRGRDQSGIRVAGEDNVLVRYAKCCSPLPGDAIIGFITRGKGVTIHRRECAKAFDTDPERRIDVGWDQGSKINRNQDILIWRLTRNKT
jgi:GTP pyrophosphokinase